MKRTECKFELNKDIAGETSVRISTVAAAVVYPSSIEKLINLVDVLSECTIPFLISGRTSNLLFKNGRYNGVLIKTSEIKGKTVAESRATVLCGDSIASLISYMADLNFGGMEGLCGIPGTVGGMIRQNAGAYGYSTGDRLIEARVYIPGEKSVLKISKDEFRFSYRDSCLCHSDAILLDATFDFVWQKRDDVLAGIRECRAKRLVSQPLEPSVGSVFKRYEGISAGYYVDKAGLKGCSIGGARVSDKHAGFIVNTGGATADDFLRLVDYVKLRVYHAFGIQLTEEVQIIE